MSWQCINCGVQHPSSLLQAACSAPGYSFCVQGATAPDPSTLPTISPPAPTPPMQGRENALPRTQQIGGAHYKQYPIQPIDYILANGIPYMEGNIVKYVTRWRTKGGIEDLRKAKHYIEWLIKHAQEEQQRAED